MLNFAYKYRQKFLLIVLRLTNFSTVTSGVVVTANAATCGAGVANRE